MAACIRSCVCVCAPAAGLHAVCCVGTARFYNAGLCTGSWAGIGERTSSRLACCVLPHGFLM